MQRFRLTYARPSRRRLVDESKRLNVRLRTDDEPYVEDDSTRYAVRVPKDLVYVCIRETGEIVTIAEARDRYRNMRWSVPVKRPTDPIQFLG